MEAIKQQMWLRLVIGHYQTPSLKNNFGQKYQTYPVKSLLKS